MEVAGFEPGCPDLARFKFLIRSKLQKSTWCNGQHDRLYKQRPGFESRCHPNFLFTFRCKKIKFYKDNNWFKRFIKFKKFFITLPYRFKYISNFKKLGPRGVMVNTTATTFGVPGSNPGATKRFISFLLHKH